MSSDGSKCPCANCTQKIYLGIIPGCKNAWCCESYRRWSEMADTIPAEYLEDLENREVKDGQV